MFNAKKVDARRRIRSAAELFEYIIRHECPENGHCCIALEDIRNAIESAEKAIDEGQTDKPAKPEVTRLREGWDSPEPGDAMKRTLG